LQYKADQDTCDHPSGDHEHNIKEAENFLFSGDSGGVAKQTEFQP
jgi:hypothetical protein